jgi:hypothetical protein
MPLTADLNIINFMRLKTGYFWQILDILRANAIQKNYIVDFLRKKILNFAIILSEENTN